MEEDYMEEEMEIPVLLSESGRSSDEECTSSCESPCLKKRHMETILFQDIVNKAFEENDYVSKSEEGILKSIF
jgi:hypothetical protein